MIYVFVKFVYLLPPVCYAVRAYAIYLAAAVQAADVKGSVTRHPFLRFRMLTIVAYVLAGLAILVGAWPVLSASSLQPALGDAPAQSNAEESSFSMFDAGVLLFIVFVNCRCRTG